MKKSLILALKIAVSVGLCAYIFRKLNIADLWQKTRATDLRFVIIAILIYFLVQILSAYRWYVLLDPLQIKASFPKILAIYYIGMFGNFFLPGTIGGDFLRIVYLRKHTKSLSGAAASVFLDRDLGLAALLMIALAAAAIDGTAINGVKLAPWFIVAAVGFIFANLGLFYRRTYRLLHRTLDLLRLKRSEEKVDRLYQSMNTYRTESRVVVYATMLSVVIQLGGVVVNWLAGFAIGLHTRSGIVDYLVFIPAISLIGMIPISINGMGWRENSYIILFMSAGAAQSGATMLALLWLVVLIITSLPGGIIYILHGNKKEIELSKLEELADQAEPQTAPAYRE